MTLTAQRRNFAVVGTSPAERVRLLQLEAKAVVAEHLDALSEALAEVIRLATEIENGGDAYPVGARDLCRVVGADLPGKLDTLTAIRVRVG